MKKILLVIKTIFELHWFILTVSQIFVIILSTTYNYFPCDNSNICTNPLFHNYAKGLNLLIYLFVFLIALIPACTNLIIPKISPTNIKSKENSFTTRFINPKLFSSLPIKRKDITLGSFGLFYMFLSLLLLLYIPNFFSHIKQTSMISLNIICIYFLISSLFMCTFSLFRYLLFKFSRFISCMTIALIFISCQTYISKTIDSGTFVYNLYNNFNSNSFFTNLITGNSIIFFILSLLIFLIINILTYKTIIKTNKPIS